MPSSLPLFFPPSFIPSLPYTRFNILFFFSPTDTRFPLFPSPLSLLPSQRPRPACLAGKGGREGGRRDGLVFFLLTNDCHAELGRGREGGQGRGGGAERRGDGDGEGGRALVARPGLDEKLEEEFID